MDDKLSCCPFCGAGANIIKEWRGEDSLDEVWIISCEECPAEMVGNRYDGDNDLFTDEKKAIIKSWNSRI